jgi:hypothetical protein
LNLVRGEQVENTERILREQLVELRALQIAELKKLIEIKDAVIAELRGIIIDHITGYSATQDSARPYQIKWEGSESGSGDVTLYSSYGAFNAAKCGPTAEESKEDVQP